MAPVEDSCLHQSIANLCEILAPVNINIFVQHLFIFLYSADPANIKLKSYPYKRSITYFLLGFCSSTMEA